ncbi:hypothetical protein CA13_40550 [Planctomycetes bacterium CA13]|uniref:3-keto-alpha-glucoside-1,2-lyase/3-keto-2-hydroxy-glucal hydratase domain-containing protein n=1 Tax=Novipirellula herctigrandis TaxID=2527986 RepID=A0A5C5Z5K2_9BACT|nr:hypothetical protein CA13_40550 [Planctomycetes bacterium CA13]
MTKNTLALAILFQFAFSSVLLADQRGKLIFEDSFERNESQEQTDEVGNGWNTNSKSRAAGNKQVDLKDGAMHIKMHPQADHAVSVTHQAEFKNGSVELRFKLEGEKDILGLDFADQKFKDVHAGHLFKVTVAAKYVQIHDMKLGDMNMKYHAAKKAKSLTDEQKAFLSTTKKKVPAKLAVGQWHDLMVQIVGDKVTASIDGKETASFSSQGFAHPTKRMLRLAVPRSAVVDDVKIFSLIES